MVDISLRATFILCSAWLLCFLIRRSASGTRYWLWTCTFVFLILLPVLLVWLPRFPIIQVSTIARPIVQPLLPDWLEAALESQEGNANHWSGSDQHFAWPFFLWLGGMAFSSWRLVRSYSAASRLCENARPCYCAPSQLDRRMKVLVSGSLSSPAAAGLFRSFVLVPESCSTWSSQDWQIVLEHESEHIDRRHSLTKLLARICCVMYWFHPMVWWAARRHSLESERICDERVVSHGIDPTTYAETLIRFAVDRQQRFERRIEFMAQVSTLQSRISALLTEFPSKPSFAEKTTMALLLCFVASATFLVDPGWSDDRVLARPRMFAALPEPNSIEDPYREPESELVRENADAQVVDASLNDPRDRYLFELLQRLSHRVPRSRADYVAKRARWALAQTEGSELIRPLLKRLEDQDWRIRAYAAYVLGLGRIREAVPALIRCMDHPVWRMRAMAAFALTEIGDPIAAKALQKGLSDPAWQVRVAAVPFFAADPRWRSVIEQIQKDENGLVRDAAIETIRRMEN